MVAIDKIKGIIFEYESMITFFQEIVDSTDDSNTVIKLRDKIFTYKKVISDLKELI